MLMYAMSSILLALVFYSISVWSEKIQRSLKKWHLFVFWIGLAFDITGTILMAILANGRFILSFHTLTGLIGIILMFIHAIWATKVLLKDNSEERNNFHKFSILVWFLWLIPFVSGAMLGMAS